MRGSNEEEGEVKGEVKEARGYLRGLRGRMLGKVGEMQEGGEGGDSVVRKGSREKKGKEE